jgi:iron complex outermembrane recepter protein
LTLLVSSGAAAQSSNLPAVTVNPPTQQTAPRVTPSRPATTARRTAASRRPRSQAASPATAPAPSASAARETAYSHVPGYVANRSATGTKTDTRLMETPQSISIVTRDQIEAQEANSAKQALRYTAGVAGESRSNFGGFDVMYGRGFILDQYWDGMRLPGSAGFFPPQPEIYGIERVELLRGPASVLFGQGSLGGIVNMVSKRPSEIPFNEATIQGGSYGRIQGGFDSTGKLDKDGEFLYRITGFAKDANNQVDFVKDQRYYISPALTWRPTKQTNWTVKFDYQNDPAVGYYNFIPLLGSLTPNPAVGQIPTSFYSGDPSFNTIKRTTYAATSLFEHEFSDVFKVRQNTRYSDTTGALNQVFPLGLDGNIFGAFGSTDFDTLHRYAQATNERITSLTTDTNGEFKFGTGPLDHRVLVGVDTQNILYKQAQARSNLNVVCFIGLPCSPNAPPDISLSNPTYGYNILNPLDDPNSFENGRIHQTAQQTGVYFQDQIKLGGLSIVGGARYDVAQSNTNTLDFVLATNDTALQRDSATTGRIGAIYEFDSGVAPYVVYATSFNPTLGVNALGNPLRPTTGELFEGGVKYQPKGTRIFLQASYFDLTQQNVLTVDPFTNVRSQIGEVHSRGFEFEGKASINESLDVIASFTHIDPVVTKSLDVDLGKVPTWIPRTIAAIWGDYTIRGGSFDGLGFALGVRHTGETFGDAANLIVVPAFTLVDAAVHYDMAGLDPRLKGARLSINATNLFDKVYVSQCTAQALDNACNYGLRRQVLASLRYRW